MNKSRLIEQLKTAVIILLTVSALLLLARLDYYNGAIRGLGSVFFVGNSINAEGEELYDSESVHTLSIPRLISVRSESGRYASAYSGETVEEDYRRFSAFLGEALGSAGKSEEIGRGEWLEALDSESVYIEFFAEQSLADLSAQLGAKLSGSAAEALSSCFCLCSTETGTRLYYETADAFFSCSTAVSTAGLRSKIAEFTPNGAYFSHSVKGLEGLGRTVLIPGGKLAPKSISNGGGASAEEMAPALLKALERSEYTVSRYTESDGTEVYLDSDRILKVSSAGKASYEYSGRTGQGSGSVTAALEYCWQLVTACLAPFCGEAEIYLSSIDAEENGIKICFDYIMDGVPVYMSSSHAAELVFDGSLLRSAQFNCKKYSFGEGSFGVLPMYQAAAMAAAEGSMGLGLVYHDSAEGIACVWVKQ